jgi:hypothetical protein
MLGIIAALANFCFQWDMTMKRWEKAIQPQIPKDAGTPRITRIRRITLLEADLNLSLSELFGRRLMANAEKNQLLHPHQYGYRKGKMCISQCGSPQTNFLRPPHKADTNRCDHV